ncbi:galectin-3-binding protein isoform X1 [Hetaerina americana]|uniref:galectin-3-binding protein isoform X1 n=1 Tax=Hetaerina americana TaxID=62018 RepID=UPI003A7F30C2
MPGDSAGCNVNCGCGKVGCNGNETGSGCVTEDYEIDNSSTVLLKIANLYAERLMSDICLVVGGTEYPAHRLILCASSEVFQVMLMNPQWSESKESRVILQETPSCEAVFGNFLKYFYTGQIHINHTIVTPILSLADKYNIKDLVKLCVKYMCSHIAHAATHNQLISWLQYTMACGHSKVANACKNFVTWNFEKVAEKSDFKNLEPEVLILFLQHNDLIVHNEMSLYKCVVRWLDAQRAMMGAELEDDSGESEMDSASIEHHMEQLVTAVMSYIRFPMMSPRQLAELLLSPLTKTYKEFFVERMAIGMSFHSDQLERVEEVVRSHPHGELLFTPRLYTSDRWGALLVVEHFPQLPIYHSHTLVFSGPSSCAEHACSSSSPLHHHHSPGSNRHHMGCHAGLNPASYSATASSSDKHCEWVVDLYPKGVWFQRCQLIVWQGTVEVPEAVLRTVRLSITCRHPHPVRVQIGVLVWATSSALGGNSSVEHVARVLRKIHRFGGEDRILNFDDLLSFDELNGPEVIINGSGVSRTSCSSNSNSHSNPSSFLVGANRDTLKVHIVIAPLSEICSPFIK